MTSIWRSESTTPLVYWLQARGYQLIATVEQERVGRLATARFLPAGEDDEGVLLDVLFASSGIESEIVAAAEELDVLPEVVVPVATAGHLLALELLSRDDEERPQDVADLRALLRVIDDTERERARRAVALIEQRGFHRGRKLDHELKRLLGESGR